MSKTIKLIDIDPLLELVNDPVSLIKERYYATESQKVLRARKEAYSQGFEVAQKSKRANIYRRGYNAGRRSRMSS